MMDIKEFFVPLRCILKVASTFALLLKNKNLK